jgi:hypothetical protein
MEFPFLKTCQATAGVRLPGADGFENGNDGVGSVQPVRVWWRNWRGNHRPRLAEQDDIIWQREMEGRSYRGSRALCHSAVRLNRACLFAASPVPGNPACATSAGLQPHKCKIRETAGVRSRA